MKYWMGLAALVCMLFPAGIFADGEASTQEEKRQEMQKRKDDWRNRQIVYQIFVDRFVRSGDLDARETLYADPKRLRPWWQQPKAGKYVESAGCWGHEIDFWGGNLQGVKEKLPYLAELGVNTIYLNPIFRAFTNHKYDTGDYFEIDPQFGTIQDLTDLSEEAHRRGIKLVLDGVFNHVGTRSAWFESAIKSPDGPYRSFFYFDAGYSHGYRAWCNIKNLPELNLENPEVQAKIFAAPDSVVQRYLDVVDGWRLDVAFDLGPEILSKITESAHQVKSDSLVIGEIWNYPDGWLKSMDGVMNFHLRQIILDFVQGNISPSKAGQWIERMIRDAGIEPVLKSWTVLSNHDTPRIKALLPEPDLQKLALVLQFTLPGAPVIYYGEELGMMGGEDPANRGPMQWSLLDGNEDLEFYRKLLSLRHGCESLQYGDFAHIDAERLLVFCRSTAYVKDLVIVAVNPKNQPITETVAIPEYRLMNWAKLENWQDREQIPVYCGIVKLSIPARGYRILRPIVAETDGYTPYKRVQ